MLVTFSAARCAHFSQLHGSNIAAQSVELDMYHQPQLNVRTVERLVVAASPHPPTPNSVHWQDGRVDEASGWCDSSGGSCSSAHGTRDNIQLRAHLYCASPP